jgi:hypothetical protein
MVVSLKEHEHTSARNESYTREVTDVAVPLVASTRKSLVF